MEPICAEHGERLAAVEADNVSLKEWQNRQNGSLLRIEKRIDNLFLAIYSLLGLGLVNLVIALIHLGK